jgi:hypothetical protein
MTFRHDVYFYPTQTPGPDDAAQLEKLIRQHLTNIPGVLRIAVGRAAGTDRPVVDNDYMLALFLEFADSAAEKAYQVHPSHTAFGTESRPLWSHVKVYDTNAE